MNKLTHSEARRLIQDRPVRGAEVEALNRHLASCAACRRYAAVHAHLAKRLSLDFDLPQLSGEQRQKLAARMEQQLRREKTMNQVTTATRFLAWGAAVLAIILVATGLYIRQLTPVPEPAVDAVPTGRPEPTAVATPTEDLCSYETLSEFVTNVSVIENELDATMALAEGSSPDDLELLITEMQAIEEDARKIETPPCALQVKSSLEDYINAQIQCYFTIYAENSGIEKREDTDWCELAFDQREYHQTKMVEIKDLLQEKKLSEQQQ
jgi:hypothetical protein